MDVQDVARFSILSPSGAGVGAGASAAATSAALPTHIARIVLEDGTVQEQG